MPVLGIGKDEQLLPHPPPVGLVIWRVTGWEEVRGGVPLSVAVKVIV